MKELVLLIEFRVFDNSSLALILEQLSEPLQATYEMDMKPCIKIELYYV